MEDRAKIAICNEDSKIMTDIFLRKMSAIVSDTCRYDTLDDNIKNIDNITNTILNKGIHNVDFYIDDGIIKSSYVAMVRQFEESKINIKYYTEKINGLRGIVSVNSILERNRKIYNGIADNEDIAISLALGNSVIYDTDVMQTKLRQCGIILNYYEIMVVTNSSNDVTWTDEGKYIVCYTNESIAEKIIRTLILNGWFISGGIPSNGTCLLKISQECDIEKTVKELIIKTSTNDLKADKMKCKAVINRNTISCLDRLSKECKEPSNIIKFKLRTK